MRLVGRANPVTRLAAAVVVTTPLLLTLDWASSTVILVTELALLFAAGLTVGALWRSAWPLLIAAPLAGVGMLLYGTPSGREYASFWLVHITAGSIGLALAISLRALAIGIPSIVLFRGVDATELADGLAQRVHLPADFVLGTLAAQRLVGLLIADWRQMTLARRARGLGDVWAVKRFLGMSFAVLVLAIRRGTKLATAMEARGFGAHGTDRGSRTWARASTFGARDAWLIATAAAVAATGLGIGLAIGTLHWVWS
ncbi:MAG: energy-coupling factor transporter transmembrane protein EcfT [Microbacteriaceae bacterium]|nr:energy-coupling factor transporter transmembrane protein EcfT [Microbacteriaceae bacterium]MCL2795255.1 energy-coupling factor transporter transmembrane protein EcfT [Microbacteriaceae bacterium]